MENLKSIQFFGDSVMKGIIYDGVPGKYHLCRNKLSVSGAQVFNRCRMGATIASSIRLIERVLPECDENTIAVLEYGGNDCNYDWHQISENPDGEYECMVPPEEYTSLMKRAINMLQQRGAQVVVSTLAPIYSEAFMRFICNGLSYNHILQWLGSVNRLGEWQAYYSELAEKTALSNGCVVLPLREAASGLEWTSMICEDGIHPTEQGHFLLNSAAERFLGEYCLV